MALPPLRKFQGFAVDRITRRLYRSFGKPRFFHCLSKRNLEDFARLGGHFGVFNVQGEAS